MTETRPAETVPVLEGDRERSLAERYRVLLDIGRTLTGTLEPEELYRAIYRETGRVLETAGFYITIYDPARDRATIVFYADQGAERHVEISYRGSDSDVLRTGEGSIISNHGGGRPILVLGDEDTEVTRSAVCAPLRYKGRVVGAISAQSYSPNAYDDDDLELLQGIADLAAVAVENARYVAEVERRRREAEEIEEIGRALAASLEIEAVLRRVAEAALEVLDTEGATVWLVEATTARIANSLGDDPLPKDAEFEIPRELLTRLRNDREPVVIDDLPESDLVPDEIKAVVGMRSALVAPILVAGGLVGALSVGNIEPRSFTRDEARVLRTLASQASVALENARLHERLQNLSLTDPLTGLPNRRHLEMEMKRELAAARRGRSLAVVLFDLDHFKEYNDRHGHVAGDEALRAFADVLSDETRAMNLVSRYGGDEFVSVLSGSDTHGARVHAGRVEDRIEQHPLLGPAEIRVSWGVAEFGPGVESMDDLIRAADADLYDAKDSRGGAGPDR